MSFSVDRVIAFVEAGGSKAEAARRFSVRVESMSIPKDQLKPGKPGPKQARKIDRQRLAEALEAQPEPLQKELDADFGVWPLCLQTPRHYP